MSLYYFDIMDHEVLPDRSGSVLPDADTARTEAVVFTGEYLSDHPELVLDGRNFRVLVREPDGGVLFTVCVSTAAGDMPPGD